jgi:hypothetical protein
MAYVCIAYLLYVCWCTRLALARVKVNHKGNQIEPHQSEIFACSWNTTFKLLDKRRHVENKQEGHIGLVI